MKLTQRIGTRLSVAAAISLAMVAVLALAACGGGASGTTSPSATASAVASPAVPVVQPIRVVRNVRYTSRSETGKGTSLLDVYAPTEEGPWPVVVMLHGGYSTKDDYKGWAAKAAKRGAVVFVPTWSRLDNEVGATLAPRELRAALVRAVRTIGAAVRFARGAAASYGGDPGRVTLFGHSYGAMGATMEAFSGLTASRSGLDGAGSAIPDALVVFDADCLLATFDDDLLARDPGLMHVFSPWDYLGRRVDFPVTVVDSADAGLSREVSDPWAEDSWLAHRDPSGELRRGLEELEALKYGRYFNSSGLKLFAERLRADGDSVTYVAPPESTHAELGTVGMEALLDALVPR